MAGQTKRGYTEAYEGREVLILRILLRVTNWNIMVDFQSFRRR